MWISSELTVSYFKAKLITKKEENNQVLKTAEKLEKAYFRALKLTYACFNIKLLLRIIKRIILKICLLPTNQKREKGKRRMGLGLARELSQGERFCLRGERREEIILLFSYAG